MSTHRKPTPEEILDDARDTWGGRFDSTPEERANAYDVALRQAGYLTGQVDTLSWSLRAFADLDEETATSVAKRLTLNERPSLPPALFSERNEAARAEWEAFRNGYPQPHNLPEDCPPLFWNGVTYGMSAERERLGLTMGLSRDSTVPPWISLTVTATDGKMVQEALTAAEPHVGLRHLKHLGRLLSQLAEHRPTGPDGKHGDLHTETCGCDLTPEDEAKMEAVYERNHRRTITIDLDTGEWIHPVAITGEDGPVVASAVMPGWPVEKIRRAYSTWMEADQAPADTSDRGILREIVDNLDTDVLVTVQHAETITDEIVAALQTRGLRIVPEVDEDVEAVERVAFAMACPETRSGDQEARWRDMSPDRRNVWTIRARRAIEAIGAQR